MVEISNQIQLIGHIDRCHEDMRRILSSPEPQFISRIGGSDFDAVIQFFHHSYNLKEHRPSNYIEDKWRIVRRYNGYYDIEEDPDKISLFCELFIDSYQRSKDLFLCGSALLSEFLPDTINDEFRVQSSSENRLFRDFFNALWRHEKSVRLYPYSYVEKILHGNNTLFHLFSEILKNKKVLAVTPFAESINSNFERREKFFPGYAYPDFDLITYNTPITYDGLPKEYYPDLDWFCTLERMKREISAIDFEIALLSCGSYALPLGIFIRDVLKKKAVYVGGCLQLFFGIMGRRYENPWFLHQINEGAFIAPLERDRYLKYFNITSTTAREAFGAYF